MNSGECAICHHFFGSSSRKFYCCKPEVRYCILCKYKNPCIQCHKTNFKQVNIPKCSECFHTSSNENQFYFHQRCNNYICPKCLLSRVRRTGFDKNITLICSHLQNRNNVAEFLTNFCRSCGTICESILDYELLNGQKCCFSCFKYNQKQIGDSLLRCMSCDQIIRKFIDAGTCENNFILCKNCVAFSNMEENQIKIQNQQFKKSQNPSSINQNPSFRSQNSSSINKSLNEKKQQEKIPVSQKIQNQKNKNYRVEIRQVDSEIIVEENGKQMKEKTTEKKANQKKIQLQNSKKDMTNSNSSSDNKGIRSLKKTILNKFPSQDNNIFLDELKETKMKRHLSMQTYVQAMMIQIQPQKQSTRQCEQCGYILQQNQMYNIDQENKQNKNSNKKYCTLCYVFLYKNQLLSFNTLNTKYNSNLGDSRNTRGQSSQKHTIKPKINFRPLINQNMHKTSTKETFDNNRYLKLPVENRINVENRMNGKLSDTFDDKRGLIGLPKRDEIKYNVGRVRTTKCDKCQQQKQRIIKTISQGNVCFECYYKKREVK